MGEYKFVYIPNHPKAKANGCVAEHRLVAEKIVGRYLKDEEVVHHMDEDRTNNNIDNLIVFVSNEDHTRYHHRNIMIKNEDGTHFSPKRNPIKCKYCKKEFTPRETKVKYCSVECCKLNNRKTIRPNKEELEVLIKENSFVKLGEMFGVSDNAIRKWCKNYGLPYKKKDLK